MDSGLKTWATSICLSENLQSVGRGELLKKGEMISKAESKT